MLLKLIIVQVPAYLQYSRKTEDAVDELYVSFNQGAAYGTNHLLRTRKEIKKKKVEFGPSPEYTKLNRTHQILKGEPRR